ncbi:response regulator transcription factor [Vallitalea guaymasensis]|uniref:Stage 0 sporulation protein A homolog n=1 Tax=Vallitalea guaymasensis TaxID=1185412 RepID=A0A8J8M8X1_9FIRM|nr:response regulator transcription factor [Vallitalea guaymasensis]QUH28473.1 response regulator transcription factor [Vallitalea guaymasensis]
MTKILVADDEENITNAIAYALEREDYQVYKAYDGKEALDIIRKEQPDILILDIMMPEYNGYDVCKNIENTSQMGIIMLTAKSTLVDKILGLELGADDYITKPFEMQELLARVRSLQRRINKNDDVSKELIDDNILEINGIKVNVLERVAYVDNKQIDLKAREFDLLVFLMKNVKITFTRDIILDRVWDMDYYGGTRTVDIHIQRIRKQLGKYSSLIKTIPKVGYKMLEHME